MVNNVILLSIFLVSVKTPKTSILIVSFMYFLFFNLFCIFNWDFTGWPESLLVGLNTIHPYFYYWGFSLVTMFIWRQFFIEIPNTLNFTSYILSFALILGMTWGSVNDLWGFFWVNDLIELILFFFFILSLYLLHVYKKINFYLIVSFYTCLLWLIYVIRLGFVGSRHSFFLNLQVASYTNYLYCFLFFKHQPLQYYVIFFIFYFLFNFFNITYILFLFVILKIYRSYLESFFFILLHLSLFSILCLWLLNLNNYSLYYHHLYYIPNSFNHLFTFANIYLGKNLVLLKNFLYTNMNISISITKILYLYKIAGVYFTALISYSFICCNIYFAFLLKRYYWLKI